MRARYRLALLPVLLLSVSFFAPAELAAQLPDAPPPPVSSQSAANLPPQYPADSPAPLTLKERFIEQTRLTFAPTAILSPALEAGLTMANPPNHYPREWSDGAQAFGRIYGTELAGHTASGYTHFAVAAITREDPRYFRYNGTGFGRRAMHALLFTVADRSDAGHRTLAFSNFAGSGAGGFIGMLWEPDGFNDVTHGYQRTSTEFAGYAGTNLLSEFSPELTKLLVKCHLGRFRNLMPTPPVDAR